MADPFGNIPAELLCEIAKYIYPDETSPTITCKRDSAGDSRLAAQHNVAGFDSFGPIYPPDASPYKGIINWSYGPSLEQIMRSLFFSPSLLRAVLKTQVLAHKNRIATEAPPLPPIVMNYPFQMLQTLIIDFEAGPVNAYHKTEFYALEIGMRTLRESLPSLWSVKVNIKWTEPAFQAYRAYERQPLPERYVYELHHDLFFLLYSLSLHSEQCEIVSNRASLKFDHDYHGYGYLYADGHIKNDVKFARLIPYTATSAPYIRLAPHHLGTTLSDWIGLYVKLEHTGNTTLDEDSDIKVQKYKPGVQAPLFLLRFNGTGRLVYK